MFDYSIDGDAGKDPNFMTLWLSQADLGLPSKVWKLVVLYLGPRLTLYRNTMNRNPLSSYTATYWNAY